MIGDFNTETGEIHLDTFLYQHRLANINKEPTRYKNSKNPSCIDFISSNRANNFFITNIVFTGLSDFHNVIIFVFKTMFPKSKPEEITYTNFKNFCEENFEQISEQILEKNVLKIIHLLKTFS